MRRKGTGWWKLLLVLPLGSVYGSNGCLADELRDVADQLQGAADDLDGGDDPTVGEFLDDLLNEF